MRLDILIAGLVLLILGIIISGPIGNILLIVAILIFLYIFFIKESPRQQKSPEPDSRYLETEYKREEKKLNNQKTNQNEKKLRTNRAERELRAWGSNNRAKRCSECGSTNNPSDAKFCADCGKQLY